MAYLFELIALLVGYCVSQLPPQRSTCERLCSLSASRLVGVDQCHFATLSIALAGLLPSSSLARAMRRVLAQTLERVLSFTNARMLPERE